VVVVVFTVVVDLELAQLLVVDLDMLEVLLAQLLLQEMHQCLIQPVEIWLADQEMATSKSPMRK
jgi:hypothetical protein